MELKESQIQEIQVCLKKIRKRTRNIEEVLESVGIERPAIKIPRWFVNRGKIFLAIFQANPQHIVSQEEFHAIAKKSGYPNMQGIGGFFSGGNLVYVSNNNVALTDSGISLLEEFGYIKQKDVGD